MSELLEYLRGRVTQAAYEAAERMEAELAQLRADRERLCRLLGDITAAALDAELDSEQFRAHVATVVGEALRETE